MNGDVTSQNLFQAVKKIKIPNFIKQQLQQQNIDDKEYKRFLDYI